MGENYTKLNINQFPTDFVTSRKSSHSKKYLMIGILIVFLCFAFFGYFFVSKYLILFKAQNYILNFSHKGLIDTVPIEKTAKKISINEDKDLIRLNKLSFNSPWPIIKTNIQKEQFLQLTAGDRKITVGMNAKDCLLNSSDLILSDKHFADKFKKSCGMTSDVRILALNMTMNKMRSLNSLSELNKAYNLFGLKKLEFITPEDTFTIINRDDGLKLIESKSGSKSNINRIEVYDKEGNFYSILVKAEEAELDKIISTIAIN